MVNILLVLALQLLIAAQGPNVPESLKEQAVSVANQAITQAQLELSATTTVAAVLPPVPVVSPPAASAPPPVIPAPVCTLSETSTTTPSGMKVVAFDWSVQNAYSGKITGAQTSKYISLGSDISSVTHWGNLESYVGFGNDGPFTLTVRGDGGTAICTTL